VPLAVPASVISNLLKEKNIDNKQGPVSSLYRNGLDLYWKGQYEEAKKKFETVDRLYPHYGGMTDLISQTASGTADIAVAPPIAFLSAIAAGVLAVLGLIFFMLMRKSRPAKSSASQQSAERSTVAKSPPITGFPRNDRPTYANGANNGTDSKARLELECQGQIRRLLLQKEVYKIGRDASWSDVEIPSAWEVISRRHVTLRREAEGYRVFDGDGNVPSRNGIWVDNVMPINSAGYLLKHGDRLTIGKDLSDQVSIIYFNPAAAAPPAQETKVAD